MPTSRPYLLTQGAVDDIREIADWSHARWGKDRTVQYLIDLHAGLEYVAGHFSSFIDNKTFEELSGGTGLHLYPIGKHYIVYVPIGAKCIAVAAIIRQGRDIPAILQRDGFTLHRELQDIAACLAKGLIKPIQ